MSSLNNGHSKRHAASGGAMAHLFPDLAVAGAVEAECVEDRDDFRPAHSEVEGGGFYSLMRQREKDREDPDAVIAAAKARAHSIENRAYEEGLARGTAEARAVVEKDFETLFAALNTAMSALERFKKSLETQAEADAVALAFAIARRVVYHEIEAREEAIFEVIHEALKQVPDPASATVRISPADYERIKARVAAFSDGATLEEMRMAPDKTIRDGDCVIDTPSGMIDARIEKRIQAVESALKSRLRYGSPRYNHERPGGSAG